MSDSRQECPPLFSSVRMLVRKLLVCPVCKGSKVAPSLSGIRKPCNSCGKFSAYYNSYIKRPYLKYAVAPVKKHIVLITVLLCVFTGYAAVIDGSPTLTVASAIALAASIFAALKFKYDQACYHKDLFEKRYELFLVVNDVLVEWSRDAASTREMIAKISGSFMRRSYYLFGENTYEFIDEFRRAIIWTETRRNETDDEEFREQIRQAREFLISFMDGQKLSDQFPELKLSSY